MSIAQPSYKTKSRSCETNAAKQRIKDLEEALMTNPSAKLRLKIKLLCVKYHPDHGDTMLSSTEVARDLIELLSSSESSSAGAEGDTPASC